MRSAGLGGLAWALRLGGPGLGGLGETPGAPESSSEQAFLAGCFGSPVLAGLGGETPRTLLQAASSQAASEVPSTK